MSLSRKGKHSKVAPEMNVTPLVDVVLVLLIIFMVILPAVNSENNIELASIKNPDKGEEEDEPFMLSIAADGTFFLDDKAVKTDDLLAHLQSAHASAPERKLALRGDRRMTYLKAREMMKVVQDVGFPGISLRVMKQPGADDSMLANQKSDVTGPTAYLVR